MLRLEFPPAVSSASEQTIQLQSEPLFMLWTSNFDSLFSHLLEQHDEWVLAGNLLRNVIFHWSNPGPDWNLEFSGLFREQIIFDAGSAEARRFVTVDSLGHPELIVVSPFLLEVHRTTEEVSVAHSDSGVFGFGDTEQEALEDFRQAVVELYQELSANKSHLSRHLESVLSHLESKIRHR